jgi:hypothetical protein
VTSFTVCARTGCDNRVEYDRKKDLTRPRYCPKCENEIDTRLRQSKQCSEKEIDEALYIRVIR